MSEMGCSPRIVQAISQWRCDVESLVDLPQHQDPCIRADLGSPEIDTNGAFEARGNTTVFTFTNLVHVKTSRQCRILIIASGV